MEKDNFELVNCNVSVSTSLARRIRKASIAEQNGSEARHALLLAAGHKPGEVEQLRSQVLELSMVIEKGEADLELIKSKADQHKSDLTEARLKLKDLKLAKKQIASLSLSLSRSLTFDGLPVEAAEMVRKVSEDISTGNDPHDVLLAAAGYDNGTVEDAISMAQKLKSTVANIEAELKPFREILRSGGLKAWIVRRAIGL